MDFLTIGRNNFPGYKLLMWHVPNETLPTGEQVIVDSRFRMLLFKQGTGILKINAAHYPFVAPAMLCLNERDQVGLTETQNTHIQAIYFHPTVLNVAYTFETLREATYQLTLTENQDIEYFQPFLSRTTEYVGLFMINPVLAQRLALLFRTLGEELILQRDNHWPCRSRSYLLEILFVLQRLHFAPRDATMTNPGTTLIEAAADITPVIQYLHIHYSEKITLSILSQTFHTNRTTLSERFRDATGMSLIEYLTRLRLRIAISMLQDTDLSIYEIAIRVGFADPTHLGRLFRKYFECTPSEYRQQYCWMYRSF